jgi:hypothetical protein
MFFVCRKNGWLARREAGTDWLLALFLEPAAWSGILGGGFLARKSPEGLEATGQDQPSHHLGIGQNACAGLPYRPSSK